MKRNVQFEFDRVLINYPELEVCKESMLLAYELLLLCNQNKGLIMTCGNGGSAADAEHIVGELMKGFKLRRTLTDEQKKKINFFFPLEGSFLGENLQQAIPAVSLVSQIAVSTAFINDVNAEMVYAQQVMGYGKEGDVLIALSASGNSKNVVNACKIAKAFGIKTIGMTGEKDSCLSSICDVVIRVPSRDVFRIQEYHQPVYHALCAMLERDVFEDISEGV